MHPVLAMRTWGHTHHMGSRHELQEWFTKEWHDYHLWAVIALVLYVFTVISLVLLIGQETPPTTVAPLYPFYQF